MKRSLKPYARIVVNHSKNCNFRCSWCHMEGLGGSDDLTVLSPREITVYANVLYDVGLRKFKIVGGEPTLRTDLPDIIAGIRSLDRDIDISMVTNGVRLRRYAEAYVSAGLNRINVSVFSLRPEYFSKHVGPVAQMRKVIDGVDSLGELGIAGKINHVFHDVDDLRRVLEFARLRGRRVNVLNEIPSLGSTSDGLLVERLWELLQESLQIESLRIEDDPFSLPVTVLTLADGTELEFKHLEVGDENKFSSCDSCAVRSRCREGIFALRLTTQGMIQPCMVRDDNCFDLNKNPTVRGLQKYLEAL